MRTDRSPGAPNPVSLTTKTWNPRYVLYAKAAGYPGPDLAIILDTERWPGGRMAGFTMWIQAAWTGWRIAMGYSRDTPLTQEDHQEFDIWLSRFS